MDVAELTAVANKPAWVELSSSNEEAARRFYSKLFGWNIEVIEDPQYGGYAMARIAGEDVAGIGGKQSPDQPTAWSLYIGTSEIDKLAENVKAAGGSVIATPFDVGDQGRMAVFQDPTGAFVSAWQAAGMRTFRSGEPNTFAWAELNARGVDKTVPFYTGVFGWTAKASDMGEGAPPYTEFQIDGTSIAGATEMNAMVPANVPSYWLIYFGVGDVDSTFKQAIGDGATELLAPQDFPGGRFAIVSDPEGAAFGLLKMAEA